MPFFYAIRPWIKSPKIPCSMEYMNVLVQVLYNIYIYKICGGIGLAYLMIGTYIGMSLHPCAMHIIAEHYEFVSG